MHVKDLTIDELKAVIRGTIMEALEELLPDPDQGRTVKEQFQQELLETQKRRKLGVQGMAAAEVRQKLGLTNR